MSCCGLAVVNMSICKFSGIYAHCNCDLLFIERDGELEAVDYSNGEEDRKHKHIMNILKHVSFQRFNCIKSFGSNDEINSFKSSDEIKSIKSNDETKSFENNDEICELEYNIMIQNKCFECEDPCDSFYTFFGFDFLKKTSSRTC